MAVQPRATSGPIRRPKNPAGAFPLGVKSDASPFGSSGPVPWLKGTTSLLLKLGMNRDLTHVFMAIPEPRLLPASSASIPLTTVSFLLFLQIAQLSKIKCLCVVSCLQKSLGYTSGGKESEQEPKSEDPEPECTRPTNKDVLSGECWDVPSHRFSSIFYIMYPNRPLSFPCLSLSLDMGL